MPIFCRRITDEEEGLKLQSLYFVGALQMKKKIYSCKAYILQVHYRWRRRFKVAKDIFCRRITEDEQGLKLQCLYFVEALQMKKKV